MTTTHSDFTPSKEASALIESVRVLDYPPQEVYRAFSDPLRLALWWGPKGFTNTIKEFDLRPGGRWLLTLHGPDGSDYENEKVFLDVVPNELVRFHHLGPMHAFNMTLTFAEESGKTRLTWLMEFDQPQEPGLREIILNANEENFDRLEENLRQA